MPNAYTFAVLDTNNLVSTAVEDKITQDALYVIGLISHYIDWQGTIDFVVDIRPASQSPYPTIDGISLSIAQITYNGSVFVNETVTECLNGVDNDLGRPDAGCTIYLGADGTIKNYGSPVWFDPNPQFGVDPNVPAGMHDFVGIYTHEIFHSLGFYPGTREWDEHLTTQGQISYFEGANAIAFYGKPVPFEVNSGHYGYTDDPTIDITRGLMFQYGNYERNRFDIGRIDLAILADLGLHIKSYEGLPLFELIDTDLTVPGTAGDDKLYGDYHANILTAGKGNDTLDGGAGNDTMAGGAGNDLYIVDSAGDVVTEAVGEGIDAVFSSVGYTLAAGSEVETLSTLDWNSTASLNLTGNEYANWLVGNAGSNILNGSAGADLLQGRGGNDIYIVDNGGDQVFENGGEGTDVIFSSASYTLRAGSEVETISTSDWNSNAALNLTGNELANWLIGNAGANYLRGGGAGDIIEGRLGDDTLDGGGGADYLAGGHGNDLYIVDDGADAVIETAGQGTDAAYTSVSYALAAGSEVETLSTLDWNGTASLNLTGNEFGNWLVGNAGANILNGGAGADILQGRGGNDAYIVDNGSDYIIEAAGGGADVVYTTASYALNSGAEVETLSTQDWNSIAALDLTGNELANYIFGNAGANVLNGGGGNDALVGLGGADTFAFTTALGGSGNVDHIGDMVSGTDRIALDDAVFTGLGLGALNPNTFVTGSAAGDADDRIVYNSATGQLFFDDDGNGAHAAILFAIVDGHPPLAASDFTVI